MSHACRESPDAPADRRQSVLVVEDDRANRIVAHGLLTQCGHAVDAVTCGREALRAMSGKRDDVVLLDIWLPGSSP